MAQIDRTPAEAGMRTPMLCALRPSLRQPFTRESGADAVPPPTGALQIDGFPILVDTHQIIFA